MLMACLCITLYLSVLNLSTRIIFRTSVTDTEFSTSARERERVRESMFGKGYGDVVETSRECGERLS
jgi:hypothetical protein